MTLQEYFNKGISYEEYMAAFEHAVESKRTSGPIQTEELIHYTELNLVRSRRVFKHSKLLPELVDALQRFTRKINIICFTEIWCGDSSQILPVVELIARESPNIQIKYLFRDENLPLVDMYLTNGGRGIPKYILLDEAGNEMATWGPRPANAQQLVMDLKATQTPYEEMKETVQRWYNADKTISLQQEWIALLSKI